MGTEGQGLRGFQDPYQLTQVAIPVLFGLKYAIGKRINIAVELGYRFTFSDYLDDVSTIFHSPAELSGNGALAIALSNRTEEYTGIPADDKIGSRRGNSNTNDAYMVWGITLSFNIFGKSVSKPADQPYKINKWF